MNYSGNVEWLKRRINKTEQNGSKNVDKENYIKYTNYFKVIIV